jgi:hypothetical protein
MATLEQVEKWRALAARATKLKLEEQELRAEICNELTEGQAAIKGMIRVKFELGDYKYTAEQGLTYKLDQDVLLSIWNDLTETDQACIQRKPTLWESGYKKLPDNSLLHEAVSTRHSMPSFKFTRIGGNHG